MRKERPYTTNSRTETINLLMLIAFLLSFSAASGQTDLTPLLKMAEQNYPSIAAEQAQAEASQNQLALEKNTFLPSLDATYEANYATFNNITGMNFPGTTVPISGPPSPENYSDMVPGSGAGLVLRWSPITFGQRSAAIEYYRNVYEQQLAGVEDEILQVKFRVAFLYLDIVGTQELIKAYEKNIERNAFNVKQVSTLVTAGLRPGVDSLKFRGELSKASTELYGLQNLLQTQIQELMELLATEDLQDFAPTSFLFENLPTPVVSSSSDTIQNPLLTIAQYAVAAQEAQLRQAKRSWLPRIELWGTAYARGSGVRYNGDGTDTGPILTPAEGWQFSRYNQGIGAQVVFPILGLANINLQNRQQKALLESSQNVLSQTQLNLKKQENIALGDLTTALRVAEEVPTEYEASQRAYRALQTRYTTGLVDYTEIILAQYDLLNAEARLKNAYVNAWKSLLKLAVVNGDMTIFLNQVE